MPNELLTMEDCNRACEKCLKENMGLIDRSQCMYCPVGRRAHEIDKKENPEWDAIDWNSSKWEELYRH